MNTRTRLLPEARLAAILDAAVTQAQAVGYQNITREAVAKTANVSPGLVSRYFSTMRQLKRDVMRAAIKRELLPLIAQGVVSGDAHAMKAPAALRERAIASLSKS